MNLLILQNIFLEMFKDMVYAPVWWYSKGIIFWLKKISNLVKSGNEMFAPGLWAKNIFVPMFGQYDWQGRIISFVMRFAQVVVRGFLLGVWVGGCLVLSVLWIIFPLVVVSGIFDALIF